MTTDETNFDNALRAGALIDTALPDTEYIPGSGYYGIVRIRLANGKRTIKYVLNSDVGVDETYHPGGQAHRFDDAGDALNAALKLSHEMAGQFA